MTAQETTTRSGGRSKLRVVLGMAAAAGAIAGVLSVYDGEAQQGLLSFGVAALFLIALFLTYRE